MTQLDDTLHRLAEIPAMWKKAHDDTLAPRGTDLTSGVSRSQPGSRQPAAADQQGWDNCLWVSRELTIALYRADGVKMPPIRSIVAPVDPLQVRIICDKLAVHLQAGMARRVELVVQSISKAHGQLQAMNAEAKRPKPPTCDTSGCTNSRENGRRCWRCTNHKRANGDYPTIARVA